MKKLLFSVSFLFVSFFVQSQDLIITTLQDSISGEILKAVNNKLYYKAVVDNDLLYGNIELSKLKDTIPNYYTQDIKDSVLLISLHKDKILTTSAQIIYCNITKIDIQDIFYTEIIHGKEIQKSIGLSDVYQYTSINKNKVIPKSTEEAKDTTYKKFKLVIAGGYAAKSGKILEGVTSDERSYLEDLKNGYFIGVNAGMFFNPYWGLGFKYSGFSSSSSSKIGIMDEEGNIHRVPIVSNLKMNFFGPVVNYRLTSTNNKSEVIFGLSIGKIFYKDTGSINGLYTIMSSETIGVGMEVSGTYFLTPNFGLLLHGNMLGGSFSNMSFTIGDYSDTIVFKEDEKESAGRYEIGVGLVWVF